MAKTITEFSVETPEYGKVDVDRQFDGQDDFWDLFDVDGFCINEGNPFFTKPTEEQVLEFRKLNAR